MLPANPQGTPLVTDRLTLHACTPDDAAFFDSVSSDPAVGIHLWDTLPQQARPFQSLYLASALGFRSRGYGLWVIRDTSMRDVGFTGLQTASNRTEVYYALAREWWGKGLAYEAASAILGYAFSEIGLRSIFASTHPTNLRSRALLQRLGMRPIGTELTSAGVLTRYSIDRSSFCRLRGDLSYARVA